MITYTDTEMLDATLNFVNEVRIALRLGQLDYLRPGRRPGKFGASGYNCPIAESIREGAGNVGALNTDVCAGIYVVTAYRRNFFYPPPVVAFVRAYDNGRWPELETKDGDV